MMGGESHHWHRLCCQSRWTSLCLPGGGKGNTELVGTSMSKGILLLVVSVFGSPSSSSSSALWWISTSAPSCTLASDVSETIGSVGSSSSSPGISVVVVKVGIVEGTALSDTWQNHYHLYGVQCPLRHSQGQMRQPEAWTANPSRRAQHCPPQVVISQLCDRSQHSHTRKNISFPIVISICCNSGSPKNWDLENWGTLCLLTFCASCCREGTIQGQELVTLGSRPDESWQGFCQLNIQ